MTIGGTGISIHSSRGRWWWLLSRDAYPPRRRIGRVMRCRFAVFVLLKQAVPLYAGLRNTAQTTERSQREIRLRVGMA